MKKCDNCQIETKNLIYNKDDCSLLCSKCQNLKEIRDRRESYNIWKKFLQIGSQFDMFTKYIDRLYDNTILSFVEGLLIEAKLNDEECTISFEQVYELVNDEPIEFEEIMESELTHCQYMLESVEAILYDRFKNEN